MKKPRYPMVIPIVILSLVSLLSCERTRPLPTIEIIAETFSFGEKLPCEIGYSDGEVQFTESARIRCRGGISSGFPKHSFTFKMAHQRSLAGLPSQRAYVLNANYIDKTMMRHKLCFDLFREMNPEKNRAAQCAYVNVMLNQRYFGLYVLMQKLNPGSLGLDKKDSLAMIFKDPPVFFGENRLEWVQEPGNYFQQNFPDIEEEDRNWYLENVMQFMIHADDSTFAHEIGMVFDLENIIDWHLLLMFTNNGDGVMKNFYLYKRDSFTPFRLAIWDYDDSFGRDCEGELKMTESLPNFDRCLILNRLQNNPYLNYNDQLKQRYKALRESGIFSKKHIKEMIEANDKAIRNEVERNFEKWPVDGIGYYDAKGYKEELDIMLQYLDIRIPQLDKELGYISH
ncbi:MAG: CotH kinase family protein [Bacteroidales bacterium]|nr:CotH kinase family protein [Bacteroidales bacterium]